MDNLADLAAAQILISKWEINTPASKMLFESSPEEVRMYIDTVHHLHRLMEHLSAGGNSSSELIRAQRLMKMSMARLEKEFHKILISNGAAFDPERSFHSSTEDMSITSSSSSSSDDGSTSNRPYDFDMVPLDAVDNLRKIARNMAKSGYGRECVRVFVLTRKSVVEESLYNLGVEKVKLNDVRKMEWELLDEKIKKWIYATKISIRFLFAREKRLCDQVFEGFNHMRDSCFAQIAKEPTIRLLAFAEAVASSGRLGPEKIFRVLDLYETLTDLMHDIEAIYCEEPCRSVQIQADGVLIRLGEAAMGIFTEFEKSVEKENSKSPIAGGTVHPLTRYVMNYLTFLLEYKETLIHLTAHMPMEPRKVLPEDFAVENDLDDPSSPLSIRLGWSVFLLVCKLQAKSDLYKDVALSYLFLMNNLHYILKKVKGSDFKFVVGEEWVRKLWNRVRQYMADYERAAWTKVLSSLTDEGIDMKGSVSQHEALKDKLKGFTMVMEETMKRHGGWVVPDVGLLEQVSVSIAEKVMAAYRSLQARFRNRFESEMYIKYTAEDMHDFVLHMFKANSHLGSP